MGRRPLQGFTLLEVMMVVLLVGILSGIAMLGLNFGGAERQLQTESDRLATLIEQVGNEAVMQNQEYGLKLTGTGYLFLCLDEIKQRWKPCKGESSLRERELPAGLEIHLLREGKLNLPLAQDDDRKEDGTRDRDASPRIYPDILLLSSGEASAASVEILVTEKPELRSEIRVDDIGRVSRDGEDDKAVKKEGEGHAG
ncbi:MAG TPA: type II secretion system minor pseudopilin GspH [Moraxellaceae bacterium]